MVVFMDINTCSAHVHQNQFERFRMKNGGHPKCIFIFPV
jgi:hypothetical protein